MRSDRPSAASRRKPARSLGAQAATAYRSEWYAVDYGASTPKLTVDYDPAPFAAAHTDALSLHDLYSCPYPRQNQGQFGLGRSFRQYRSDLTWSREAACCVPDTDCADCRHYAAGSAIVTARMNRHIGSVDQFRAWLDYVDTYLAVWIPGYTKGANLCPVDISPTLAMAAGAPAGCRAPGCPARPTGRRGSRGSPSPGRSGRHRSCRPCHRRAPRQYDHRHLQ